MSHIIREMNKNKQSNGENLENQQNFLYKNNFTKINCNFLVIKFIVNIPFAI